MSVWSGLKNIIDTMNRGAHQDDWNKIAAQEEAIKSEQQRRLLATNADARAQAGEGRAAEEFGNTKSGWSDEAVLRGLKVKGANQAVDQGDWQAKNRDEDRALAIRKTEGEIDATGARTRQADRGLELEAGRLGVAQKEALRMAGLTDMQINAMSAQQAEQDATREGRIENTNFQNSPGGRRDVETSRMLQALKELDPGSEEFDAVTQWLLERHGVKKVEKPGWFGRTTSAPRPPQAVIGSQGARLPGMGPR